MIASLMMYARPELDAAHSQLWAGIAGNLREMGIDAPDALSQDAEEMQVWTDPLLVLSQTCGMPYRLWLKDKVELVATPDYGLQDCSPGYYRSPLIVRSDDARSDIAEFQGACFAFNQTHSQSGFAAPFAHLKRAGFWFTETLQTEAHLASAAAVAEGRADIAALDGVTWRLFQRYDPSAAQLRVLEWTDPTPGLPLITAKGRDVEAIYKAVSRAIDDLEEEHRAALGIKRLVRIDREAYLAVPNPDGIDYTL
jgi:ABC-type phosphate/phosphonate transport system substrate-binding protein